MSVEDLFGSCGCPIPAGFEDAKHLSSCPRAPAAVGDRERALERLRKLCDDAVSDEVQLQAALALLETANQDDERADLSIALDELTEKIAESVLERLRERERDARAPQAALENA